MSILNKTLWACCAVFVVGSSFGQLTRGNDNNNGVHGSIIGNGGVSTAAECNNGSSEPVVKEVPNLIWVHEAVTDPFDGGLKTGFRPETIFFDDWTIRYLIETKLGIEINCEGFDFILQAIRLSKQTPVQKCTAFVSGPGAGLNTNFDTGLRKAQTANLDELFCAWVFSMPPDGPCLGTRCLLFSPPLTKYSLEVDYVRRDKTTGTISAPYKRIYCILVKIPTIEEIKCNIEYFSTVAAGVTQKCKIDMSCVDALNAALDLADPLEALLEFETVIAFCATDFETLLAKDEKGNYDARFIFDYLIDSDEEPIGCLLIEQANALLWH